MNHRSLEIFKEVVETYIELGEPVGSRTLSKRLNTNLSPATIRNVMADLEDAGLLYSPHTSAGRIPTAEGLRFFVDGLLEFPELDEADRMLLESECSENLQNLDGIIEKASMLLSGLSQCASLVTAPKMDHARIKHVEFIELSEKRGLVIIVSQEGGIENRLIELPIGTTSTQLKEASNYINHTLAGQSLMESRMSVMNELNTRKNTLDQLVSKIVEAGLATWEDNEQALIIKGQSHLLQNIHQLEDIESIKKLFEELDNKESVGQLIDASLNADGVKIFIGAEHHLFKETGCSMVVSPYMNNNHQVIGAIGVIGPLHMNYRRIIPMVNYSAKIISKLLGGISEK